MGMLSVTLWELLLAWRLVWLMALQWEWLMAQQMEWLLVR